MYALSCTYKIDDNYCHLRVVTFAFYLKAVKTDNIAFKDYARLLSGNLILIMLLLYFIALVVTKYRDISIKP